MPFQIVQDVAECRLVYSQDGNERPIESVFHVQRAVGWTQANIEQQASQIESAFGAIDQLFHVGWTLEVIRVRDLSEEFGPSTELIPATPQLGTGVLNTLPPGNNALIRFSVADPPPRRGRLFHPSVPEDSVNNTGALAAGQPAAYATAYETFFNSLTSALSDHVVVSRYERDPAGGSRLREVGGVLMATYGLVTAYSCAPSIASQRDRNTNLPA